MNIRLRYLSTTLALLAVGTGIVLLQPTPPRPVPADAGRATPTSRPALPAPPPTARQILLRDASLGLTPAQRVDLEALDRKWQRDIEPLEAAVQAASAQFSLFMLETGAGRGTSLGEVGRRLAGLRELSAVWRERRRHHSDTALGLLTETQRRSLLAEPFAETRGGRR